MNVELTLYKVLRSEYFASHPKVHSNGFSPEILEKFVKISLFSKIHFELTGVRSGVSVQRRFLSEWLIAVHAAVRLQFNVDIIDVTSQVAWMFEDFIAVRTNQLDFLFDGSLRLQRVLKGVEISFKSNKIV